MCVSSVAQLGPCHCLHLALKTRLRTGYTSPSVLVWPQSVAQLADAIAIAAAATSNGPASPKRFGGSGGGFGLTGSLLEGRGGGDSPHNRSFSSGAPTPAFSHAL
eukprot:349823-Chlamydomonas_euryale.AAC.2